MGLSFTMSFKFNVPRGYTYNLSVSSGTAANHSVEAVVIFSVGI